LSTEAGGPERLRDSERDLRSDIQSFITPFGADVVHVHNGHHFSPMPARTILAELDVPCVNTVHDRTGEFIFEDVLRLSWAHLFYVSNYVARALPSPVDHSIQWLGVDRREFTPDGPLDSRLEALPGPVIFHPARMLEWKGLHVSIRALAELRKGGLPASLGLCGSTDIVDDPVELRRYRGHLGDLAAQVGVAQDVHFFTFDRSRIADAYRAADLVWYPTVEPEPLGLVPIEAMSTGVPVVVSDTGGMQETVVDGESGIRVPVNDHRALAEASLAILSTNELYQRLVANGLERSRLFDLESYVDVVEGVYQGLAS
jgi:glycosyltransferase involved in cell wall biosynthesis